MTVLQLDEDSLSEVFDQGEAGQDFYCVNADIEGVEYLRGPFLVRSAGWALPLEPDSRFYDLSNFRAGDPVPTLEQPESVSTNKDDDFETTDSSGLLTVQSKSISVLPNTVKLAPLPKKVGARPLLGSLTLKIPTVFHRFTSTLKDPCFFPASKTSSVGELRASTYLSTDNDRPHLTTGFGVVGRLALPMPFPASYCHHYVIPATTKLSVGTVAPNFGQAGGGVEVRTDPNVLTPNVTSCGVTRIDDY